MRVLSALHGFFGRAGVSCEMEKWENDAKEGG